MKAEYDPEEEIAELRRHIIQIDEEMTELRKYILALADEVVKAWERLDVDHFPDLPTIRSVND